MSGVLLPYQNQDYVAPIYNKPTTSVYYSAVQPRFDINNSNIYTPGQNYERIVFERQTPFNVETSYPDSSISFQKKRNLSTDLGNQSNFSKEQLRRSEVIYTENAQKSYSLQQRVNFLEVENHGLKNELHRLTGLYNNKITEIEGKYHAKVQSAVAELENPGGKLDQQRIYYENALRELDREWGLKFAQQDEKLAEKNLLISTLEDELRKTIDHVDHTKYEYNEEFKKQVNIITNDEQQKYQIALKSLETKLYELSREHDLIIRKNQELQRALNFKENEVLGVRTQFDAEASKLKNEVNALENHFNYFANVNERLNDEVNARNIASDQLQLEVLNLQIEAGRFNDIQTREINRLIIEQNNERRRWEETERQLRIKLGEFERIIKALEQNANTHRNSHY